MENASKALLIAGAILIVVLLIAIGMLVYNQSKGVIDTGVTQMNSSEIQMFNAQFIGYEGKQNWKTVKMLIQTIVSNNQTYKYEPEKWVGWYTEALYHRTEGSYGAGQIGSYPIYPNTRADTKPEKMITEMNAEFNKFTNFTSSDNIRSLEAQTFIVDLCYGPNGLIRNVLIHGGNYWKEKPLYYEDLCE